MNCNGMPFNSRSASLLWFVHGTFVLVVPSSPSFPSLFQWFPARVAPAPQKKPTPTPVLTSYRQMQNKGTSEILPIKSHHILSALQCLLYVLISAPYMKHTTSKEAENSTTTRNIVSIKAAKPPLSLQICTGWYIVLGTFYLFHPRKTRPPLASLLSLTRSLNPAHSKKTSANHSCAIPAFASIQPIACFPPGKLAVGHVDALGLPMLSLENT